MRVVSLLASATEIVCALGAEDCLVGRSHECDNPSWVRSLPSCTEPAFDVSASSREIDAEVNRRIRAGEPLYRIHTGLIGQLAPDLIITQEHCAVCAVTPTDMKRDGCTAPAAQVLALTAGSLDGILDGILRVARALGRESGGRDLVDRERRRLDEVRLRTAARQRRSLVLLEWIDPLFAMGNWAPELVEIANGEPLLGTKGSHSRSIAPQSLIEADPEYLVVAPCGFGLQRALNERGVLRAQPWWKSLRAVQAGRVAFADGNLFFNRSGMTISRTAEIIAEILHGEVFGTPTQGVHWIWEKDAR